MAAPAVARLAGGLLPSTLGHAVRGRRGAATPPHAIEAFALRAADLLRATLATGREHGFLAYVPAASGEPLVAEDDAAGDAHGIEWHWRAPDATVAFSVHTHPGDDAACVPSGIDLVGALVRGDHLLYVLSADGRLSGWRFRDPTGHPRAVDAALRALSDARRLDPALVDFLHDALDALMPSLVEPVYAARLRLVEGDGCLLERAEPDARFFLDGEWR